MRTAGFMLVILAAAIFAVLALYGFGL